ncbi:MAG: GlsB/YeaQ/YmgE family stress response membrane protein [Candidatus Pacebacteria bacterium]|nr:GlsB/YeaQ/YmgE family stress response membrane protein [Candidatus Paceibacterota bacterium]
MNILLWILLGALAGWLASVFMKSNNGMLGDIVLGVVGAFVGGYVMNFFNKTGVTGFNIYSILVATLGAVVIIFIGRLFRN